MTGPLMLIVIGVLFLLNNLFPGEFSFGRMWPVILITIGLVKVFEYFRRTDTGNLGSRPGGERPDAARNSSDGPPRIG